jgi:hypothetical protein
MCENVWGNKLKIICFNILKARHSLTIWGSVDINAIEKWNTLKFKLKNW